MSYTVLQQMKGCFNNDSHVHRSIVGLQEKIACGQPKLMKHLRIQTNQRSTVAIKTDKPAHPKNSTGRVRSKHHTSHNGGAQRCRSITAARGATDAPQAVLQHCTGTTNCHSAVL
eukprot:478445-Pelagomonas_calceolata.AAC.1